MIVYGDRVRRLEPSALLSGGLFDAGCLAQGVIDALGDDDPVSRACLDHVCAIARGERSTLDERALPSTIEVRTPEGFAFYALDPALVAHAARGLPAETTVLGIRSIGTTLAAAVAAEIGARRVFSVRPSGHPFARRLALSPGHAARILEGSRFAVVDEGPGLSGSSFGAVLDFLEDHGVPLDRIDVLPSHDGDLGPHASERHRARWMRVRRRVTPYAEIERSLPQWFAASCGTVSSIEDVAGGRWRAHRKLWPAVAPQWERRKYLLHTDRGRYLLKFVGLGQHGARAVELSRRLAADGLVPRPIAFVRGYVATEWLEGGDTLSFEHVARYLRARLELTTTGDGATPAQLAEMIRCNTGVSVAPPGASPRVAIDGRMHRHEWIGAVKTDAVEHHAGHDLVGEQPIAWDVAGAAIELGLDRDALCRALPVPVEHLDFYERAYLAFQLGAHSLAAEMTSWDESEAARLREAARRYEALTHR